MKQETANTFSEGLNYDLNPTTTPNNVLTDCVNGTFLTFNGDELALQNDAGNTTIDYKSSNIERSVNYGALYNWYTLEKIAPNGWHVPSKSDYEILLNWLDTYDPENNLWPKAGKLLKEAAFVHWLNNEYSIEGTNDYGFSAVGGGSRQSFYDENSFVGINEESRTWTTTKISDQEAYFLFEVDYDTDSASTEGGVAPTGGVALRLLKDNSIDEGTLTDIDGNIYSTIKIGDQVWMAANYICTKLADATPIPNITDNLIWPTLTTAGMCYYDNLSSNAFAETTIEVVDSVHLTEGFYPIGIKEYGGILYIVSGKKPDQVVKLFSGSGSYDKGEIVYDITFDDGIKYYYESLEVANTDPLPAQSNESWLYIGLEKDFINKYGYVEFGSYPSPAIADPKVFDGSVDYLLENVEEILDPLTPATDVETFKVALYSPKIINDSNFQAGVNVVFHSLTTLNTDNVSHSVFEYNNTLEEVINSAQFRNIYKVRLLHQLTNGFIDLTDDVWEKYAKYLYSVDSTELNQAEPFKYWFNDATFKYYCPHNFKGKLAITTELENLDDFSLVSARLVANSTQYKLSFLLDYENTTQWNQGVTPSYTLYYTLDGSDPTFDSTPLIGTINLETPTALDLFLDIELNKGKTLRYIILPNFYFDGVEIPKSDFPTQFLDEHTINGNILLTTDIETINVAIDIATYTCEVDNSGYRIVNYLNLVNSNGHFINDELVEVDNKYQYCLEGNVVESPNILMGTYTIGDDNKAVLISTNPEHALSPALQPYIEELIEATIVKTLDVNCIRVPLTINVNKTFGVTCPISVSQVDSTTGDTIFATYTTDLLNPLQFIFDVIPTINYTISPNISGVVQTTYNYTNSIPIGGADTINYGLVTYVYYDTRITSSNYDNFYRVDFSDSIFGGTLNYNTDFTIAPIPITSFVNYPINITVGIEGIQDPITYNSFHSYNYGVTQQIATYEITFAGLTNGIGDYDNIAPGLVVENLNQLFIRNQILPNTSSSGPIAE